MEMTDSVEKKLKSALRSYKHQLRTPVRDGFSICLFCKNPLKDTNISFHGPNDTPFLQARTNISDKTYQVYSAHPKPALSSDWFKERRAYFKEIQPIISQSKLPVLVLGDFNSVPWEHHFKRFMRETNLQSTLCHKGYKITWPVYFPLLGVPMDHILISKNNAFSDLSVGPYVGSDHYPISLNIKAE